MKAVRKIIENAQERIYIEVPEEFRNKKLEVILLAAEETQNEQEVNFVKKQYDFSDLVGKLQWKGDAVVEQRKLRDEWE